jgi:hypothetical protein
VQEQIEMARRKLEEASRKAEEAGRQSGELNQGSIHKLWEQLNKPRINLEADGQHVAVMSADGLQTIEATTGRGEHVEQRIESSGNADSAAATADSLTRSVDRLEKLVRQVSSVARDVSDVGAVVGRALVALQQHRASVASPPPPKVENVAAAPPAAAVTPALPVAAQVSHEVVDESEPAAQDGDLALEAGEAPAAKPRPAWVDEPPKRVGNVWREVIATEEYASDDECFRAANVYLLLKTYERVQRLLGNPDYDSSLPSLTFRGDAILANGKVISSIGKETWDVYGIWGDDRLNQLRSAEITVDYVRREIAKGEYTETVERTFGPMEKLYTQVEFSQTVDAELLQKWDAYRRRDRMAMVGVGAGSVLGLLGLAYGLLKVDTWTKGYYSKRLFLGVPAAIIGLLALLGFMAS